MGHKIQGVAGKLYQPDWWPGAGGLPKLFTRCEHREAGYQYRL